MDDTSKSSAPEIRDDARANEVAALHHSNVVAYLASAFITILTVFSGGAFTAGLGFLTSEIGRNALKSADWRFAAGYMICFALTFSVTMLATLVLINYSFKSWNDHRQAIFKKQSFAEAYMMTRGGYMPVALCTFAFMSMLAVMTCALFLVLDPAV